MDKVLFFVIKRTFEIFDDFSCNLIVFEGTSFQMALKIGMRLDRTVSEKSTKSFIQSRLFETLRDVAIRHLIFLNIERARMIYKTRMYNNDFMNLMTLRRDTDLIMLTPPTSQTLRR